MTDDATTPEDELPGQFELDPRDLFSRRGFDDGDLFWDLRNWLLEHEALVVDCADLLVAVVEELVVPSLEPRPTAGRMQGAHNPVRAFDGEGDGAELIDDEGQAPDAWPESVVVATSEVLALARGLARPATDEDLEELAELDVYY